jgi:hypothetical protein
MKRNILAKFAIATVLVTSVILSCKKADTTSADKQDGYVVNYTLAKTSNELAALQRNSSTNLIRTMNQFDAVAALKNTPLEKLSSTELAELRSSLVCRDGIGVVSLKYGTLEKNLSYDDFATVLSWFGMDVKQGYWGFSKDPAIIAQLALPKITLPKNGGYESLDGDDGTGPDTIYIDPFAPPADHIGYYCSLTLSHTCKKNSDFICLSGC